MQYGRAASPEPLRICCFGATGARLAERVQEGALELAVEVGPLGPPAVAVFGLEGGAASTEELLLISRLASSGAYLVCCGAGTTNAPLADRCQLLLAGAREILDSDAPDFAGRLLATLRAACEQVTTQRAECSRLSELMRRAGVVGQSDAMFAVFRSVDRLSGFSDLPVLITGETGTGKDLVARCIHQLDTARSHRPFVPVNCGALDLELSGSGLFGHRRGSFTGALDDRAGLFRAAHQGVLLLDEVGELSLALQIKLLRVLQTRRVLAVGEDRETEVDVRVIAATNRDLRAMVSAGTFREDLFHRLNVTAIHIPPLRERPDDIAPLVAHFVSSYSAEAGRAPLRVAADVLRLLERCRLPGNARQIENLVHHAVIYHEYGAEITLRDLPPELLKELTDTDVAQGETAGSGASFQDALLKLVEENNWSLERSLGHLENLIVRAALRTSGGNQSQAARKLGITPRSVYNKLRRTA